MNIELGSFDTHGDRWQLKEGECTLSHSKDGAMLHFAVSHQGKEQVEGKGRREKRKETTLGLCLEAKIN